MRGSQNDQDDQSYGLRARLNLPYKQAIEKVTAGLKEEGFGVLTEIDVKGTLKNKRHKDGDHDQSETDLSRVRLCPRRGDAN